MLASLFDWWIAHGNEGMEPLSPRKRTYRRYVQLIPHWAVSVGETTPE